MNHDDAWATTEAKAAILRLPHAQYQRARDLIAAGVAPVEALRQARMLPADGPALDQQHRPAEPSAAAGFAARALAGIANDPGYQLEEAAEHEAAHGAVAHALGLSVEYMWVAEGGSGLTVHSGLSGDGYEARTTRGAVALAPQIWLREFAWRRFPAEPRGCQHDWHTALRAGLVDDAARLARRVLADTDTQTRLRRWADALRTAPQVAIVSGEFAELTVRLVEVTGRARRSATLAARLTAVTGGQRPPDNEAPPMPPLPRAPQPQAGYEQAMAQMQRCQRGQCPHPKCADRRRRNDPPYRSQPLAALDRQHGADLAYERWRFAQR